MLASCVPPLQDILDRLRKRDPHQPEFHQAVGEVVETLKPLFSKRPELMSVFERLCEPDRAIMFRVVWMDDEGMIWAVANPGRR